MAAPTEAELRTMLQNAVNIVREQLDWCSVNATDNLIALTDVLEQSLEGDFVVLIAGAAATIRAANDSALRGAQALFHPIFLTWAKIMDVPETDYEDLLDRLYDRFIATADRVTSRQFTYGAAAAGGGNVGNGTIRRVTRDGRGFDCEGCHAEVKTFECISDENTGANRHEEVFEVRGEALGPDALEVTGSGLRTTLKALSARDSAELLGNPSFSSFSGTAAAPTAITNWTSDIAVSGANYQFVTGVAGTAYYRDFVGDTTPYALDVLASAQLSQSLRSRNTKLDPNLPYLLQVAWNREVGGATGTMTIRMGAQNTAVIMAAQAGWNTSLVPTVFGTNSWYRSFDEADLDIRIEWVRTGGTVRVDDVLLVPGTLIDGTYFWVIGGTTTFRREDSFTTTDTEVGSIIQAWIWRTTNPGQRSSGASVGPRGYLPHTTGAGVTIADP